MTKTETNWVEEIGKPAFDSIAEMVASVTLDWDRLEELIQSAAHERRIEHGDLEPSEEDAELLEELDELRAARGDCEDEDDAQQRIDEDPLSIELGGWWCPGGEPEATEYRILLCTGGPAVRIVGDIGQYGEAHSATLEVQNWFKPWTAYDCDEDVLLEYVGRLYLGD